MRTGLFAASLLALSSGAAFADYELNILHINDLHSRIESINKFDSTCSAEEEGKNECFGGVARLKTLIDQKRQELTGKNVLLLNAGDNFQGSLFFTTYKGATEAEFLNLMKFDAMTVGNHEFDEAEDGLASFLDKVAFPVVTANVLPSHKSKIGDRIKPSIVLDVGGQKIGIVGAVANDTPESRRSGRTSSSARTWQPSPARSKRSKSRASTRSSRSPMSATRATSRRSPRSRTSTWWSAATPTACFPTPTKRPKAPTRRWSTIPAATRCRWYRPAPTVNISAISW